VTPEQVSAIYDDLRGDICLCGGYKKPGRSFCKHHYFRLPKNLQDALYKRAGYCETFLAAARQLKLDISKILKAGQAAEEVEAK
jgi:hypothetical protein